VNQGTANLEASSKNLKPAAVQEFLYARSSRKDNRDIVRDLLRGVGAEVMAVAAAKGGVAAALSGFGDSPDRFDLDPSRYAEAFSHLVGPAAERASRPVPTLDWQVSDPEQVAYPNAR
jgi:hypothetical protein